jgi:hypothetical protein
MKITNLVFRMTHKDFQALGGGLSIFTLDTVVALEISD